MTAYSQTATCPSEDPKIIPVTRQFLEEARVIDRVSTLVADVVTEPPKANYDLAVMRNLIQVLSLEDAGAVLRNVAKSLTPGGPLFIVGNMLDDSRLTPGPRRPESRVYQYL